MAPKLKSHANDPAAYTPANELPDVTVVILTYERPDELRQTVAALREHLLYPAEKLHWLVADDASPGGVEQYKADPLFEGVRWLVNTENVGWGATVNAALNAVDTDIVYFTEDDYVLTRDLDLWVGAALLTVKPNLGMLRYRSTGGLPIIYHQDEADLSGYAPSADWKEGEGSYVTGRVTYEMLGNGSLTPYLYSNGPHLRTRRFMGFYGPYSQGRKLGDTEEEYAIRTLTMMRAQPNEAPGIAILPEWIPMHFQHIGQSYQLTAADKGENPTKVPPTGVSSADGQSL